MEWITFERLCNTLREERDAANLTLATLCDMVLEENAPDRSDKALIRGVRALLNKHCLLKIAEANLIKFGRQYKSGQHVLICEALDAIREAMRLPETK